MPIIFKQRIQLIVITLLYAIALSGCAAQVRKLGNEDLLRSKQTSLTLEQRVFNVSDSILIKAFVNAFSTKGLIILTLEKDAGFIMAEGPEILDYDSLLIIKKERDQRWDKSGRSGFALPDVTLKVTVNFYKKDNNKTLAKMKINPIVQTCMHPEQGQITKLTNNPDPKMILECPPSPTMVSMWYQNLWSEIEKSIFMQRETILK